ncbi:MAG: peptide chain release factor N(5)-glutamine methyltransferase [Candidatus Omnitrophica bacterium]|nr:peptide chain release factor N(5)-glutamine methyltransferase [Candidatus Omnitrophota bacterium]
MNEAELLFSDCLGCQRVDLYLNKDKCLSRKDAAFISSALSRRIKGEPIQYILGKTEFMGLELKVNRNVLIPRPETERLVETAIEYANRENPTRVLDLGTGSGCIAVALAKYLKDLEIDASDIAPEALSVAKENALLHAAKINFIRSDLFDKLEYKEYGIIVSNPPYIAEDQIRKLQPQLQFEPKVALDGGSDGLDFYRKIILKAAGYLKRSGLLIMEIGFQQKKDLEKIFDSQKLLEIIKVVQDYNDIERVMVARKVEAYG